MAALKSLKSQLATWPRVLAVEGSGAFVSNDLLDTRRALTSYGELLVLADPFASNESIRDEKIRIAKLEIQVNQHFHPSRSLQLTRPIASSE